MPCYSPLSAWQTDSGEIVFAERGSIRRELTLPCGQCIGCRLERSRQWAIRCYHEAQTHELNSFVTLTYSDEYLPRGGSLVYYDFQRFMKRLRNSHAGVRFFMCGEYGDLNLRPHYHSCLFNCFFTDRVFHKALPSGFNLYTSAELSELWPFGFSSIGDVSFESAAYIARYVCKKVTGAPAEEHYTRVDTSTGEIHRVEPEFCQMSRKPGIGAAWFSRYHKDAFGTDGRDYVVVRGVKMKPPKYYDNLLKSSEGFLSDYIEFLRTQKAQKSAPDNTPERLAVREEVTRARLRFKARSI